MTDALDVLRAFVHADIDKAVVDELERAKREAEHARRSIGQQFGWAFTRPHGPKFYARGEE